MTLRRRDTCGKVPSASSSTAQCLPTMKSGGGRKRTVLISSPSSDGVTQTPKRAHIQRITGPKRVYATEDEVSTEFPGVLLWSSANLASLFLAAGRKRRRDRFRCLKHLAWSFSRRLPRTPGAIDIGKQCRAICGAEFPQEAFWTCRHFVPADDGGEGVCAVKQ